MNFLENFLLNQQNKPQNTNNYGITPMQTPEQFAQNQQLNQQRQNLANDLQQPGFIRGLENFLIHPKNALLGAQSQTQELPISYQQPLVGIDMTQQDYDNAQKQGLLPEQNGMVSMGAAENPRKGGLLRDFSNGLNDNLHNSFNINNLENDNNKGFANRIGEATGTGLRFLNSPAGRGLLTAGIVGSTGGNGLQALTYGTTAGVTNQKLKTQDQLYRKALQDEGIDTSDINGYIDGDTYQKYSLSNYRNGMLRLGNKKLSSTDYNNAVKEFGRQHTTGEISDEQYKLYIDALNKRFVDNGIERAIDTGKVGQSNQTYNTRVNTPKRLQIQQQNANTYAKGVNGNLGLGSSRLGLQQEEFEWKKDHPDNSKTIEQLGNLQNLNQDLQDFKGMFDTVPNPKAGIGYQAEVAKNRVRRGVMSLSPNEQAFETSRNNLKFRIITALDDAGKRVTNVEMNQIDKALPSLDMTYAQKQSAYKQLNRLIANKYGIKMGDFQSVPQASGQTFKSGKYQVTVH